MIEMEVKVTRKYQVTIPERVRSSLGIKVGDKLIVRAENEKVVLEPPRRVSNPVEFLWNLSEKPMNVDVIRLVEKSWAGTHPENVRRATVQKRRSSRRERT
jgi:AbrB family looped-hinge helix DNA binding protein